MKLIDAVWAAVAIDAAEQIEGLCAVKVGHNWMPLIAADRERLEFVREEARKIAAETGQMIRVIRLSRRDVIETFNGRKLDA